MVRSDTDLIFQALQLGVICNPSRLHHDSSHGDPLSLNSLMRRVRLAREGSFNFPEALLDSIPASTV